MRTAFAACLGLVLALPAAGQETLSVQQPEPGTIRLGDTARVTIRIEGKGANPRPIELPQVEGLGMRLSQPARSTYTFYDGRQLIERSGVQYVLELLPRQAGDFTVPSFPIWTGTRSQPTPELRLSVKADLVGAELGFLDIDIEPQRVYVHEPVRVQVNFGVQQGVSLVQQFASNRVRYLDIEVQANWLNEFPGGERLELPDPTGNTRAIACNRRLEYAAFDGAHELDGKRWQQFSLQRAFLPTRLGKIELPAPLLRFNVVRPGGRRNVFGRMTGGSSENYYVYGQPMAIEVLPIPEEGRPTPFFGAVGRFTLAAALDRGNVKVGNSVKLTLTVRGQGNFEFLRLPTLEDLPGFHKLGEAEAERDADKVVVTYDLTPLSADVEHVPAIGWNYFDTTPGVEQFVEVATTPLPLTVEPLAAGETLTPLPESEVRAVTPGVDDIFDLPQFDGPRAVAAQPALWWRWAAVIAPWVLVSLTFVGLRARRRARADVVGQRARGARKQCEAMLQRGDDPLDALSAYLGDRLGVPAAAVIAPDLAERLVVDGLDREAARDVATAVEQATAQRYGGGAAFSAADVRALVQRLEGERFGASAGAVPWVLWALLACGASGGELAAQAAATPAAAEAVAAYRAGDYEVADAAFAQAFASTGDRRHWRGRGNCFFRLGDLPRARWAFECARLGLRRDPELAANLRVVRTRLELAEPSQGFAAELRRITAMLSPTEQLGLCAGSMLLGALCLVFGWRRIGWRWLGAMLLVPGLWLAADLLWWQPNRPVRAVAAGRIELFAEPRPGMAAVATVRAGAEVELAGRSEGAYVRVRAGEREGYTPRDQVLVIE